MGETRQRVLQDDANFRLEIIDWQGLRAIKKSGKPTTPKSRLERMKNDIYGMDFFAKMDKVKDLNIYIPKIYESGDDYYIRQYISDAPVVEEQTDAAAAKERLDELAKLLAAIDRIEPYGEVRFVGSSNYTRLHKSIGEWCDENVAEGLISTAESTRVKQISAGFGEYIRPRIAHGDMSPYKHAYIRPNGHIALIDFENFTPEAARYFDVAWSYTRLYSFAVSADIPKNFLSSFLKRAAQAPNKTEQLMAVLLQRTVAMQKDADADLKSKGIDYRGRAKELLGLVLKGKLELLHS